MRKNNNYQPKPDKIKHVQEVLELLAVMTNNHYFEEIYSELGKGENNTMTGIFDRAIKEGKIMGFSEGKTEGRAEGKELIITLNNILIDSGRMDDLIKASKDEAYLNKLIKELLPSSES